MRWKSIFSSERIDMNKKYLLPLILLSLVFSVLAQDEEGEVPAKPLQLTATAEYEGSDTIAHLRWRDMSDNELGFEIYRTQGSEEFEMVGRVGADTDNYKDVVGQYVSGAYTYKVQPFNQYGKGEESNAYTVWF